jgi:hypothetical protein
VVIPTGSRLAASARRSRRPRCPDLHLTGVDDTVLRSTADGASFALRRRSSRSQCMHRVRTSSTNLSRRHRPARPMSAWWTTAGPFCSPTRLPREMDSPVEGEGFEPSVPRKRDNAYWAPPGHLLRKANCRTERGGSQKGLFLMRYRWFQSISLQRRVCESLFRALGVLGLSGTDKTGPLATLRTSEAMTCRPVSRRVGNVKNNDPSLIEPIAVYDHRRAGASAAGIGRLRRPIG